MSARPYRVVVLEPSGDGPLGTRTRVLASYGSEAVARASIDHIRRVQREVAVALWRPGEPRPWSTKVAS